MPVAIKVENLSKAYQIGEISTGTVSRDIERWWAKKRGKEDPFLKVGETNDRSVKGDSDIVWSLKDINFEIEQGDAVGIIGRNGAGKSTLLKLLSRVTSPTTGIIKAKGRIASLLEVGTGFHPDLTGRENIFLNGAILGMRKKEILKHFDAIVDFAGVARYIDTPVKRYSSGMYVRLAFAVAAHLESEILIVDEVLAVGDTEFQKKCLGKMGEVSKGEGRTVLFVSHNMGSVAQLCNKSIVLNNGNIVFNGSAHQGIDFYTNENESKIEFLKKEVSNKDDFQFLYVYNCNEFKKNKSQFKHTECINLFSEIYLPKDPSNLEFALSLYDKHKRRVFTIHEPLKIHYKGNKVVKLITTIPSNFLTPGHYSWLMCINQPGSALYDLQDDICNFSIIDAGSEFTSYENEDYGCVFPRYSIQNLEK